MGYTPPPLVDEAVKRFDESKKSHDLFVRSFDRGERAYQGILDLASDAAQWRHKYTPKYAFNLLETIVSNTVEMGLKFDVRPSPHSQVSLPDAIRMANQAEVMGDLLRSEHRIDEMEFKQRPLFLCDAIGGRGILKSYWNYRTGPVRRQTQQSKPVLDPYGNKIMDVPVLGEAKSQNEVIRDHSTCEVIDPRDFILHEAARELQPFMPGGAQYLFHRCWYSYEQLKMQQAGGFLQNVESLKDAELDFSEEYKGRDKKLFDINRTKDMIEVLEYWKFEDGVVKRALVGNRKILLRDLEESPFSHGEYPFIIVSSARQLSSTIGMPDIELVAQLQEMLWELGNQRLDNVELINNWITLVRSDVDDIESFQHYPGAIWSVDSLDQVGQLQPPYQLGQVSMEAEALIKADLQNVSSAAPLSGGNSMQIDQKTATGVSIVMNAAQKRVEMKKYLSQQGLRQEANMRLKNCQQFISDTRLVHILGPDGKTVFREIDPMDIRGEFVAELEPMGESNMRQERRAEAMTFGQFMLQSMPLGAASGTPASYKEVIRFVAERWGIQDWERFFSQQPSAMGAMAAGGGVGQNQPALPPSGGAPGQPNMGTTSSTAVDASKPSATGGLSMSPGLMLQRAMAMRGGGLNA